WTRTSGAPSPMASRARRKCAGTRRCITKSCTIRSGSGPSQISWDSSTRNSTARSSPDAAEFTRAVLTASFLSNGDNPPLTGTDSARTTRADRHADCLVKRKPMKHYDEAGEPVDRPDGPDPSVPDPPAGGAEGGALVEPAEQAVARLEAQLAELKDRQLRLAAEYD